MDPNEFIDNELTASMPVDAGVEEATQLPPDAAAEPVESNVDYAARARELEAENQRLAQTIKSAEQLAHTMNVQQQQQAEENAFKAREERIHERASQMSRDDAERYLADEYRAITADRVRAEQARAEQSARQWEQRVRALAQPQWVDRQIKEHGLTDSEREYLSALDPETVPVVAKFMATQKKQNSELKNQIEQLSRTQQAGIMQASGLGSMGGVTPASVAGDLPTDPDERALAIYHQLMGSRS